VRNETDGMKEPRAKDLEPTVVRGYLLLMLIASIIQRIIESASRVIVHYVRLLGHALLRDLGDVGQELLPVPV
jgi:putative exporter of polyketide antibiotics